MQENVFLPLQQDFYSKSRHASPQNSSQIYAYKRSILTSDTRVYHRVILRIYIKHIVLYMYTYT